MKLSRCFPSVGREGSVFGLPGSSKGLRMPTTGCLEVVLQIQSDNYMTHHDTPSIMRQNVVYTGWRYITYKGNFITTDNWLDCYVSYQG